MLRGLTKTLRGKATTPQIYMATILGGMLGFVPGFLLPADLGGGLMQAPATILGILFLVVVLNANLAVFGVTVAVAKLISFVLLPVSFHIGRFLLDGPLSGLFAMLINAPVFAWCGLERYATTGGLFVGLLFGIGVGFTVCRAVKMFRTKMVEVEEGSERYKKLTSRRSVRAASWLLFGKGKGKKSYRELVERQSKGSPVRIVGVVAVLVVGGLLWFAQAFFTGPAFRNAAQSGLESWNGATVDLAEAALDLAGGSATIGGLAMADREELTRNVLEARTVTFDLGTNDLLRKRLVIERVVSSEAVSGAGRQEPGRIVVDPDAPAEEPPAEEGGKTIEDYVADAKKWKERLEQVSDWLQKVAGGDEPEAETEEQRDERVAREADVHGWTEVIASHLINETPTLLIRELAFEGLRVVDMGDDLLDIRATNLSTHPGLVEQPLALTIESRSGKFSFSMGLDAGGSGLAQTRFVYNGLSVDSLKAEIPSLPLTGGTMDLVIDGGLDPRNAAGVWLDVPLQVKLRGTTVSLPGMDATTIDELMIPIGLRGPLAAPRITLDDAALADALVAAGKAELAKHVRSQAGALLEGTGLGDKVPDIGGVITGEKTPAQILEEAKKKAAEEAKKKAAEEAKKRLPGGLFGGNKEKK